MKNANDGRDDRNLGFDDAIERRLGRALKNGEVDAGPCLNAEELAAWADDGLDADERAAAEAHAASCDRCQATLAAMIRAGHAADEALPVRMVNAVPGPGKARAKRVPVLAWLVPLTAIAAALIVWIAVPQRGPTELREAPAQPVDRLAAAPAAGRNSVEAPRAEAELRSRAAAPRAQADAPLEKKRAEVDDRAGAAEKQLEDSRSKDQAVAGTSVGAAAANALAAAAPRREAGASAAPVNPAPAAAPAPMAVDSFAAAKTFARATAAASGAAIVSANPVSRWRIIPGGAVQHSADGGSTWQAQQTGSTVTLTAGASPSASVCWLVGPEGTVLLSVDGRSWRKIAFPERIDLVGVIATDDRTATVTFVDGRTLTTTDAGVTWR